MSSKSQSSPPEPIQLGSDDDLESVVSTYDVVLADFYADWCGPCKMMEPTIDAIATETDAAVLKIDVDRFQDLAGQYGIQGIPALLLFADGDLAERFVGVQQQDDLEGAIVEHSG